MSNAEDCFFIYIYAFFISNTFISNAMAKIQVNAKQHPERLTFGTK